MPRKDRNTKQKELIKQEFNKINTFFNAKELYDRVKKKDDRIGIATVYRFLNDTSKKEHIHSYQCNRRKVYSSKTANHCHFICTKCGKTTHFSIKKVDFLKNNIKEDVCHFQIDVYGICTKCKE